MKRLAVLAIAALFTLPCANSNPKAVEHLTVFDSHNRRIGSVIGFLGSVPIVAFSVDTTFFALVVGASGFAPLPNGASGDMNFQTPDCSGVPFVGWGASPEDSPMPRIAISGGSLYVAAGATQTIFVNSVGIPHGTLGSTCTTIDPTPAADLTPLRFLADLPQFSPSFRIGSAD